MNNSSRLLSALILLLVIFGRVSPAAAQEGGTLTISAPETQLFPVVSFHMDAYNSQGEFISTLKTTDVQVIENGQAVPPTALEKAKNGVQVIVALNTSPTMATQNGGVSQYQQIQNTLLEWGRQQPKTTLDDFSLSTPTGLFLIRERDPEKLVKAITDYQPDLLHTQPSLASLAEALDLATEPLGRDFMKRSILYITPTLPAATDTSTLQDLIGRAKSMGLRVHVWLVDQAGSTTASPNPLEELAASTGGKFETVSASAPFPQVDGLFEPLRWNYQVQYNSVIKTSGAHRLSVQASQGQGKLQANTASFNLTVQPPNPIFLSPPTTIQRSIQDGKSELSPTDVALQILVEFPDEHRRDIKATRLFADSKLIAENTAAPFDQFTWSIAELTTPGRHLLRIEAEDNLGLIGTSIEAPVEILVEQPAKASVFQAISGRGMIAIGAVSVAGAALVLVLVFSGTQRRAQRSRQQSDKKLDKDPVTQPVKIRQDASRSKKDKTKTGPTRGALPWAGGPAWLHSNHSTAPARLVALDENEQPITGGVILLARQEITFGADPQRATQVLESPTVDGLHARLYREPDGSFHLADQNSIAGTWINFAPVTPTGARLENGDLLHIGKVMFRFELTDAARENAPEIKVIDLES